jgi:hypothetical protein
MPFITTCLTHAIVLWKCITMYLPLLPIFKISCSFTQQCRLLVSRPIHNAMATMILSNWPGFDRKKVPESTLLIFEAGFFMRLLLQHFLHFISFFQRTNRAQLLTWLAVQTSLITKRSFNRLWKKRMVSYFLIHFFSGNFLDLHCGDKKVSTDATHSSSQNTIGISLRSATVVSGGFRTG